MDWIEKLFEFLLNQLVGFFVGIVASFLASVQFAKWTSRKHYKQYGTLVGTWVEANDLLQDRPFSVCTFSFSDATGKLKLVGNSLDNNAEFFYEWESVVLHIDDQRRRMSYVYETRRAGDTKKDEGFGCYTLEYNKTKLRWDIVGGYFQDLDEARPRHCKMVRFDEVAKALKRQADPNSRSDQKFLIAELLKVKNDSEIRSLFGW